MDKAGKVVPPSEIGSRQTRAGSIRRHLPGKRGLVEKDAEEGVRLRRGRSARRCDAESIAQVQSIHRRGKGYGRLVRRDAHRGARRATTKTAGPRVHHVTDATVVGLRRFLISQ